MVALNFNAAGVKPNVSLDPVPSGEYTVMITKSEEKPTKSGNGTYLELEMTLQGGEYAGRKVYDRLNLKNPNQQAVDIAYATLSAICHVTGRINIQDSQHLHGVPFKAVVVKLERDDQAGVFRNEVRGYKDLNGNDPGSHGAGATQQATPSWAGGGQQAAPQQQYAPQPPYQQQAPQGQQYAPQGQQPPYQPPPNTTGAVGPAAGQSAPPSWAAQGGGGGQGGYQPPQQQAPQQQPQGGPPSWVQNAGAAPQGNEPPPWVQNNAQG